MAPSWAKICQCKGSGAVQEGEYEPGHADATARGVAS